MARPNILIFMPDQLRADAVGAFGNPVARTPNIDALAARGVRFDDAWCQHPVCGPSRVSLMTGWYPHVAGHRTLDHLLGPDEPNLLRLLRDAGYRVCMPGHRGDVFAPGVTEASTDFCGYLDWPDASGFAGIPTPDEVDPALQRAFYVGRVGAGDGPRVDGDEATVRTAIRWIEEATPGDAPWAMWVPLMAPHLPFLVEEPWFSLHDRADMPAPIDPTATVGKPEFMVAYRATYGWDALDEPRLREISATYYGMVSRVDDQLGRLLAAVERTGQTDDTVVVFLTDHGEYLGDHGLVEKWPSAMDPSITRNPLVVAGPGVSEGETCEALVELVDVLPTLLDFAETEAHHTHFGRSLTPLLRDPARPHRDAVFTEGGFSPVDVDLFERAGGLYEPKARLQHEHPELVGKATTIRTSTHTYVHRQCESDELYDRVSDPSETRNLIEDPSPTDVSAAMRDRILDWLVATSDVIPWDRDPRFPDIPHGWR